MGQPLSMDLGSRVMAAIDDGLSCRAAAARFGVAPSTAIRWHAQRREVGHFEPRAQGGDMRSHRVEKRASDILALWEAKQDITLEELPNLDEALVAAAPVAGYCTGNLAGFYTGIDSSSRQISIPDAKALVNVTMPLRRLITQIWGKKTMIDPPPCVAGIRPVKEGSGF